MSTEETTKSEPSGDESAQVSNDLEKLAQQKNPGLVAEFWEFLRYNKKWWLTPIIIVLLLVGLVIILVGTSAAPFLYPFI